MTGEGLVQGFGVGGWDLKFGVEGVGLRAKTILEQDRLRTNPGRASQLSYGSSTFVGLVNSRRDGVGLDFT